MADTLEGYPDLFIGTLVGDSLLAAGDDMMDDETDDDGSNPGWAQGLLKISSYGQFSEDQNADRAKVNGIVKESQREGFFMFLGFSLFAILPSLLWLVLPEWVKLPPAGKEGQTISLTTVVNATSAVIMWLLGVWKSQFLDSNWALFGVEAVLLFFICVLSSYGVGTLLLYVLGGSFTLAP